MTVKTANKPQIALKTVPLRPCNPLGIRILCNVSHCDGFDFPTPSPVTPETAALLARLEESDRRARTAEIELSLSMMRIVQLEERLRLLRITKYGPRGESLSAAQLALFEEEISATLDEVAAEAARAPLPETPAKPRKRRKQHPGRQTLPADLPRVVNVAACPPAQCPCGHCGAETAVIGYEESERLDVEPEKFFVAVTRREKRACRNCKQGGVATAPVEAAIVEKGLASNRVVINAVVSKYCAHRVPRTRWRQRRRGAVEEMRAGPSKSAIRSRLQTTVSCCR